MDVACFDWFDTLTKVKKWSTFQIREDRAMKVLDQDWRDSFCKPTIPQEARECLRVEQRITSMIFKNPNQKKLEDILWDLDQVAHVGVKYASFFIIMAEPS